MDHGYTLGVLRALMGRNSSRKSDALCQAATGGEPEAVKLLIELGADVNPTNRHSQTALFVEGSTQQLRWKALPSGKKARLVAWKVLWVLSPKRIATRKATRKFLALAQ